MDASHQIITTVSDLQQKQLDIINLTETELYQHNYSSYKVPIPGSIFIFLTIYHTMPLCPIDNCLLWYSSASNWATVNTDVTEQMTDKRESTPPLKYILIV